MKKTLKAVLAALLVVCLLLPLAACGNNATTETKLKIAIPNDTTNEARALLLLQDQGYIKLKDGAGITATVLDIVENPKNIEFSEGRRGHHRHQERHRGESVQCGDRGG